MHESVKDESVEKLLRLTDSVTLGGPMTESTDFGPLNNDGVTTKMVDNHDESFWSIAPIISFSDYDEAIDITNGIDLGLTSSVVTSDIARMNYFIERVETDLINVNDSSVDWEIHAPFGDHAANAAVTAGWAASTRSSR